jgi:hypothetical protein
LDADFNELFTADWFSAGYSALRGDYLFFRDGEKEGVYDLAAGGEIFSAAGASIEYFDGERAIVQTGSFRGDEAIDAKLVTINNETLAEGFLWLGPDEIYNEDGIPAESFIGIKDGKAVLIGRNGETLKTSAELPDARNIQPFSGGLYTYYYEVENEDSISYGEGLLNADLEIIVPAGKYPYFGAINTRFHPDETFRAEDIVIEASKELGDSDRPGVMLYRADILDVTGKVIMDNVTHIFDWADGRIAIKRGFSMGLIDADGSWIVKRSIFSDSLQD